MVRKDEAQVRWPGLIECRSDNINEWAGQVARVVQNALELAPGCLTALMDVESIDVGFAALNCLGACLQNRTGAGAVESFSAAVAAERRVDFVHGVF